MRPKAIFLRFTNGAILAAIILLTLSGLYGLVWPMPGWMFDLHRIAAWGLAGLVPSKLIIALGSLTRGMDSRFKRSVVVVVSLLNAGLVIVVFGLALYWSWSAGPERLLWYQTAVSWHWYIALAMLIPFLFHVWQRWPRPRRADFTSRRSALKLASLGGASVLLWWLSRGFAVLRSDPAQPEQPSGSREAGSFTGLGYPVNMMLGEGKTRVDPAAWRLAVVGAVEKPYSLTYEQILVEPSIQVEATLDCTDGWYTVQVWHGVPLARLLARAGVRKNALGFSLRAVSGYAAFFTLPEADEILLSTHVGGIVYDHWHGFPLRAVVPSRRGWQWVKWLEEVRVF